MEQTYTVMPFFLGLKDNEVAVELNFDPTVGRQQESKLDFQGIIFERVKAKLLPFEFASKNKSVRIFTLKTA
jgi:hypothetical protein